MNPVVHLLSLCCSSNGLFSLKKHLWKSDLFQFWRKIDQKWCDTVFSKILQCSSREHLIWLVNILFKSKRNRRSMFNTKLKINNASDESTISYFPFISVSRCFLFFFLHRIWWNTDLKTVTANQLFAFTYFHSCDNSLLFRGAHYLLYVTVVWQIFLSISFYTLG